MPQFQLPENDCCVFDRKPKSQGRRSFVQMISNDHLGNYQLDQGKGEKSDRWGGSLVICGRGYISREANKRPSQPSMEANDGQGGSLPS